MEVNDQNHASPGETPVAPRLVRVRAFGVFLLITALAMALLLPLTLLAYRSQIRAVQALLELNQQNQAGLHEHEYAQMVGNATADLLYWSSRDALTQILRQGEAPESHPLHEEFLSFAEHRNNYASVTLFDSEGHPLISIGHERGHAFVRSSAMLASQPADGFVLDSLGGEPGSLHISPFTLRKRGEVVESPLRPTLSLARVLHDDATDTKGLLVLEMHGEGMLLEVERLHANVTGMPLLVNGDGYYLMGETSGDEWGFLFPQRREITLASRDSDAWARMQSKERDQFRSPRGLYTFVRIVPEEHMLRSAGIEPQLISAAEHIADPHSVWYSISFVPLADLNAKTAGVQLVFTWSGILLSLAALLLAWFGARFYGLRFTARYALEEANSQLSSTIYDLRRSYDEISLLNEMEDFIQSCDTVEELFTVVERYVRRLFPYDSGGLYILLPREHMLEQVVRWGDAMETEELVPEDACWAFRRDQPHMVPAGDDSLRCPHQAHTGPGGSLCLPMGAKGALIGMFHIKLRTAHVKHAVDGAERTFDDTLRLSSSISEHVALTLTNMQLRDELRAQSIKDPLTELYNRRYMEETFEREWHRAQRQRQTLAVILFDVDHFKQVNDTRGHEAGDLVLSGLGRLLRDLVRQEDVPCRYGGEEFIVIMPGADLETACERAERLRIAVEQLTLTYQGEALRITISLGVVAFPMHGQAPDTLIHAADAALYDAKHAGRNCVKTPLQGESAGSAPKDDS